MHQRTEKVDLKNFFAQMSASEIFSLAKRLGYVATGRGRLSTNKSDGADPWMNMANNRLFEIEKGEGS